MTEAVDNGLRHERVKVSNVKTVNNLGTCHLSLKNATNILVKNASKSNKR